MMFCKDKKKSLFENEVFKFRLDMSNLRVGNETLAKYFFLKRDFFGFFQHLVNTALSAPPLRFHCVGGCWDRTQGQLGLRHWLSDALTTRLDLIH
jgi:hypothetical protein